MFGGPNLDVASMWSSCPSFNRFLVYWTVVSCVLSLFIPVQKYFIGLPELQFHSFQLWRLFTAWIFNIGIINSLISALILYISLYHIEKRVSTVLLIMDFMLQSLFIQLGMLFVFVCINVLGGYTIPLYSAGTFNLWLNYFTRKSMCNPDAPSGQMCCPSVSNKYVAAIFTFILFILGGQVDNLVSYALAMIQSVYFQGNFVAISPTFVRSVQASWLMQKIAAFLPDFIKNSGQGIGKGFGCPIDEVTQTVPLAQGNAGFQSFGGPGRTLDELS